LAEVTRLRPELAAFFGCLYYAALRPAEAVALRVTDCDLPPAGWGRLTLTGSLPRTARAWTSTRSSHEPRGLKHRPEGTIRMIPIPPELVRLLHHHLQTYGCAPDRRLFRGAPAAARSARASTDASGSRRSPPSSPGSPATPPLRPYDLRHAALSLWLASGAPPAEIAARAGHSVYVLLTTYAHGLPGYGQIASQHIDRALHAGTGPPLAHKSGLHPARNPSVMRPCHSWTRWDTAGPNTTRKIQGDTRDLHKH
jgi:integrase